VSRLQSNLEQEARAVENVRSLAERLATATQRPPVTANERA
jgi:hypothetical protein